MDTWCSEPPSLTCRVSVRDGAGASVAVNWYGGATGSPAPSQQPRSPWSCSMAPERRRSSR